jgi:hypothetical protein
MQQREKHNGTRTAVNWAVDDRLKARLSDNSYKSWKHRGHNLMEELHTDSIDGGHEAIYRLGHVPGRGCTPTDVAVALYVSWAVGNSSTQLLYL